MNARADVAADELPEQPRVLLVDDDEVNLLLTSIALRERGFAVSEATSGEAARPKNPLREPNSFTASIFHNASPVSSCQQLNRPSAPKVNTRPSAMVGTARGPLSNPKSSL